LSPRSGVFRAPSEAMALQPRFDVVAVPDVEGVVTAAKDVDPRHDDDDVIVNRLLSTG
jgi:hypothetical protein